MGEKASAMVQHKTSKTLPAKENTAEVKAFFDQWKSYQTLIDHNYLCHREVYALLRDYLKTKFTQPFSVLDLGCGDAGFMSKTLAKTCAASYQGVDLSEMALKLAKRHFQRQSLQKNFICGDFSTFLARNNAKRDVIWIGLSFHHLSKAQKGEFLARSREKLNQNGVLMMFEPSNRAGESRDAYLKRWWANCKAHWTGLDAATAEEIRQHVFHADFPEPPAVLQELGRLKGFQQADILCKDAAELYTLFCFQA